MTTNPPPPLGTTDIAQLLGVNPDSVRKIISRSRRQEDNTEFPRPDGHLSGRPWWHAHRAADILTWNAARPGRGAGGGRPRTQPTGSAPKASGVDR